MPRFVFFVVVLPLLLAGCDRPEEGIGPPYTEKGSWALPGVFANATLYEEPDGSYRMSVLAVNKGEATYRVSNVCVPPWMDRMETGQGERVDHREPVGYCAAFGLGPFPPGASEEATFEWDGRLWEEDGPRDAPPGLYAWNATFEFFNGGSGAEFDRRERITLVLHIIVE